VCLVENRKRKHQDDFELYQELKDSVVTMAPPILDTVLPASVPDMIGQLNSLLLNFNSRKQNNISVACLMGRNLSHIQDFFYNDGNIAGNFIDCVHQLVPKKGFSKTYIYFLIKLYKFAERFKKLEYVSIAISKLETNFTYLSKMIEREAEFWTTHVPNH